MVNNFSVIMQINLVTAIYTTCMLETISAIFGGIGYPSPCFYPNSRSDFELVEEDNSTSYPFLFGTFEPDVIREDSMYACVDGFTYQLQSGFPPPPPGFFLNDTTGELFVLNELDREQYDDGGHILLNVLAMCKQTRYGCQTHISITLRDINDNAPTFHRENQTVTTRCTPQTDAQDPRRFVLHVTADDPDSGENGTVTYDLIQFPRSPHQFHIDPDTGVVSCTTSHWTTGNTTYHLEISAKDGGPSPLQTSTSVTVDLTDDVSLFAEPTQDVMLAEDARLYHTVALVSVMPGGEGRPEYYLFEPPDSEYFNVDRRGLVSLKKEVFLDVTHTHVYNLTVGAMVRNGPMDTESVSDQVRLEITVYDVNNHAPVITPETQSVTVVEGSTHASALASFSATDRDSGENAEFDFAIDNHGNYRNAFSIDPHGNISLDGSLDREVVPSLMLKILAIDKGEPRLTGTATLMVTVTDVNDNFPETRPQTINLFRNDASGAVVTEVEATDVDSPENGPPFHMSLPCDGQCPCPDNPSCGYFEFSFNESAGRNGWGAGVITIGDKFYFPDEGRVFHLPIVVRDSGNPPMSGTRRLTLVVKGDSSDFCYREESGRMRRLDARKSLQTPDLESCEGACHQERTFLCESFAYTPTSRECLMAVASPDTNRLFTIARPISPGQTFGTRFSCYYGDKRNDARRQKWMVSLFFLLFLILMLSVAIVYLTFQNYNKNRLIYQNHDW